MNSKKDQNGRNTIIAASSNDGTTIITALADSTTHRLLTTTTTVGDNGNNQGNAILDENSVSVWTALSSTGDIVEIYGNPLTKAILIKV